MKKAYFQYYETFENIVQKLRSVESQNKVRMVIINYGLHGEEPEGLSEVEDIVWVVCKEMIDQQLHRREVNTTNRKKRAVVERETKAEEETQEAEPEGQQAENAKPKADRFVKPTVEEVKAYAEEKEMNNVDAEKFVNYYESNGWKVGKNPMKSWKAAVANWNKNRFEGTEKPGGMWGNESAGAEDYANFF